MTNTVRFVVHEEPVWRAASDYIGRIGLEPFELPGEIEQVWLRRAGGDEAVLCCIPFRAYGLALGDTVRLSGESVVTALVRPSGNRALRALVADVDAARLREIVGEIRKRVADAGLLSEWSGGRHVAIDVPAGADAKRIMDYFDVLEAVGVLRWEWSDVVSFQSL